VTASVLLSSDQSAVIKRVWKLGSDLQSLQIQILTVGSMHYAISYRAAFLSCIQEADSWAAVCMPTLHGVDVV